MAKVLLALRKVAGEVLHLIPTSVWRKLAPKSIIGLCYHLVSDSAPEHVRHYRPLNVAEFERDLRFLQAKFVFSSYNDLLQRQPSRRHNRVVLTFDDGFSQCANVVAPILARHGISCIFFVITDLIDNQVLFRESLASLCINAILRLPIREVEHLLRELELTARFVPKPKHVGHLRPPIEMAELSSYDQRLKPLLKWLLAATEAEQESLDALAKRLGVRPADYLQNVQPYLSTSQIRELHATGFTIGAHSCSHRLLQSMSRDDAEREIVASCNYIRELTGQDTVPFAFPYFGGNLDRRWLADLRYRHEVIGLFFDTDGLREDADFVVQRVFAERFGYDRSLDSILRRAWSRPRAWRRS